MKLRILAALLLLSGLARAALAQEDVFVRTYVRTFGGPVTETATFWQRAPEVVDRERRIAEEQVRASGKPENLVPKIVDGKVEAFYKDVVLMSQPWIREDKKTIADLVKETSAKVGENIVVRRFARFRIGEE